MNEISRNPAHTVTELANARQHQNGGLLAWLLVRTIVLVRIINDLVPILYYYTGRNDDDELNTEEKSRI